MAAGSHPLGRQSLLKPSAFSYLYSAVTRQYTDQNPFADNEEFRLGPLEARDFPVLLDQIAHFMFFSTRFQVATEECGAAQAGTISIPANSSVVTGLGTAFTSALKVGQTIWVADDGGTLRFFQLASLDTPTSMQIKSSAVSAITAKAYGLAQSGQIPFQKYNAYGAGYAADGISQLTGTVSLVAGANTLAGVGTLFTTELAVGAKFRLVDDGGAVRHYVVDTITDATTATVKGLAAANATAVTASRWFCSYADLKLDLHVSGGARGLTLMDAVPVKALQGKNGGGSLLLINRRYNRIYAKSGGGPVPVGYLLPPGGAVTLRVYNLANDARYFHAHLYGSAIKT